MWIALVVIQGYTIQAAQPPPTPPPPTPPPCKCDPTTFDHNTDYQSASSVCGDSASAAACCTKCSAEDTCGSFYIHSSRFVLVP
jgi:hypothetical protein